MLERLFTSEYSSQFDVPASNEGSGRSRRSGTGLVCISCFITDANLPSLRRKLPIVSAAWIKTPHEGAINAPVDRARRP
jgi:hypothetical protein